MIFCTALDTISIGKIALDKTELSSKPAAYPFAKAFKVNPESMSWCPKAEVLNIRLAIEISLDPLKLL